MLKIRRCLDFTQEALGADDRRQLGPQHLDGDLAVVLDVLGQVHGGHAALAELALEAVAVGQGLGQAGKRGVKLPSSRENRHSRAGIRQ